MFVQLRVWKDCFNSCTFCSLGKASFTSLSQKRVNLQLFNEFLPSLTNVDKLGLLGGEFFEGQLKGVEQDWERLILTINNQRNIDTVFITANLIHEQYFLDETISLLKKRLVLCTSYDSVGRFHTPDKKESWFKHIDDVHKKGILLCCTVIPTQDLIKDEDFDLIPTWMGFNLCEPHLGLDWVNKHCSDYKNYNEILNKENKIFSLPKRKDFLAWMMSHSEILKHYNNYNNTHANDIFVVENNKVVPEILNRLTNESSWLAPCGHPVMARCYKNSKECMMCDCLVL